MADSTLIALNQMYGITTGMPTNSNSDFKNQQALTLEVNNLELSQQKDIQKINVALNDNVTTPSQQAYNSKNQSKFMGYIEQDYDVNSLQKKAGNYWVTKTNKNIVIYTGSQFIECGSGIKQSSTQKIAFVNIGNEQNIVPKYPNDVTYQNIKQLIENHTMVQIQFLNEIYRLGNIRDNSLQFSFDDQDNYKQIRLFDSTQDYKIEYFVESKSNYEQLN